jgi:hypothetical protein
MLNDLWIYVTVGNVRKAAKWSFDIFMRNHRKVGAVNKIT